MRRLISITVLALFLAVPLWAQHGGGGHAGFGGGHGGGFAGGHAAGFSGHSSGSFGGSHSSPGVHAYSGPRSSARARGFSRGSAFSQRNFSRGPFLHDGFRGNRFNRFNGNGHRGRNGYPWWGWGWPWTYYDPWWWGSDSSYDQDYEHDRATADEMNQQSLEEQRMLRQEEADGDQDVYAHSPTPAPRQPAGEPVLPATVLVFRDKHQREIQNYAIVGPTLWNFAPQRTEKISLADLDLPATTKANDDRGLMFRLPGEAR